MSIYSTNLQNAGVTGKWYFDRFGGPHGEIAKSNEIVQANKQNEGKSFTFTKDGKVIVEQAVAGKVNRVMASYKLLPNSKVIIISRDTMRIMLLTSDILELYPTSELKPALFLKRSQNGKTLMSAPTSR